MKLNAQDLKEIVTLTLEHYNQRAEEFWTGTRDHDVSQNIAAMSQYIEGEPRLQYSILARLARPQSGCRTRSHRGRFGRGRYISPTWRVPTVAAKRGSSIFSSSTAG